MEGIPSKGPAIRWNYSDRRSLQLILPGIYIGPLAITRNQQVLDAHRITTLIAVQTASTRHFFPQKYPDKYRYEAFDFVEGSVMSIFSQVKPFVEARLARDERLLFYDETGNAKAPLLVCSYLMDKQNLPFQEAFGFMLTKRLSISLTHHEQFQMRQYEDLLRARNTIVGHVYTASELARSSRRRKFEAEGADDDHLQGRTASSFEISMQE